jgi:hypothetical protein
VIESGKVGEGEKGSCGRDYVIFHEERCDRDVDPVYEMTTIVRVLSPSLVDGCDVDLTRSPSKSGELGQKVFANDSTHTNVE